MQHIELDLSKYSVKFKKFNAFQSLFCDIVYNKLSNNSILKKLTLKRVY